MGGPGPFSDSVDAYKALLTIRYRTLPVLHIDGDEFTALYLYGYSNTFFEKTKKSNPSKFSSFVNAYKKDPDNNDNLIYDTTCTTMANMNAEFYFQDIVLRVEDQLFKVPRHMFVQHSQVFRDMFDIPIPPGTNPDGSSNERPLTLETIEKQDFVQLLRCLYPPQFQRVIGQDFSLDEWKSVLKLTNLYDMTEVKDFAVDCMTPLLETGSPSLQIHLAQTYNVPQWLQPARARLVDRSSPINENDVIHIGLAFALEVCALRENALRERVNASNLLIAAPPPQRELDENWLELPITSTNGLVTAHPMPQPPRQSTGGRRVQSRRI